MKHKKKQRRKDALERLQSQLESGVKTTSDGEVKLSDKDIKRINKEILILEGRAL